VSRGAGKREGGGAPACLDIEIDERRRSVRVYDPRLFQAGRRAFCKRLIEAASGQPGIRKAAVDLASASCRIEFGQGSNTRRSMADAFVSAVRQASAGSPRAGGTPWWRGRKDWTTLTAFQSAGDVSLWETFDVGRGRSRLRHAGLPGDRARLSLLADTLAGLDGVDGCRVSPWSRQVTIDFRSEGPASDRLLDRAEQVLEGLKAPALLATNPSPHALSAGANGEVVAATGGKRLMYLALAGGSFALTLVALVVPGIPTVPCLMATSYYLARSSRRLNERLRRTSFFGPILREWEGYGGLSWSSKGKLIGLTLTLLAGTVALAPVAPVTLIVIVLFSSLSIYGITRMPALPGEPEAGLRLGQPARPSLPTP
jgi:uncharacterized membrane protein YbaN (DUF454 family)